MSNEKKYRITDLISTPKPSAYKNREGYDIKFLGTQVKHPTLSSKIKQDLCTQQDGETELKYARRRIK